MSGRPRGPYTVKNLRPVQFNPYRWWNVYANSSLEKEKIERYRQAERQIDRERERERERESERE